MVERSRRPCGIIVAGRAIVREISRDVVRICRCLEIALVALVAACIMELIIAVGMAALAGYSIVFPCQRKRRGVMIERRWLPYIHRVA